MGVSGRGPFPAPSHAAEAAKALTLGLMDEGCAPSLGAQEDLHLAWVPDFFFLHTLPCPRALRTGLRACRRHQLSPPPRPPVDARWQPESLPRAAITGQRGHQG